MEQHNLSQTKEQLRRASHCSVRLGSRSCSVEPVGVVLGRRSRAMKRVHVRRGTLLALVGERFAVLLHDVEVQPWIPQSCNFVCSSVQCVEDVSASQFVRQQPHEDTSMIHALGTQLSRHRSVLERAVLGCH